MIKLLSSINRLVVVILRFISIFGKKGKVQSDNSSREPLELNQSTNAKLTYTLEQNSLRRVELILEKDIRVFDCFSKDVDWPFSQSHSFSEYKIQGNRVYSRLIEAYKKDNDNFQVFVKDNVVLESEIKKRLIGNFEELLRYYQTSVEWHEVEKYDYRFFILLNHPEILPPLEYRKTIRQEIERLEMGKILFMNRLQELGLEIFDSEFGFSFNYGSLSDEIKAKLQPWFNDEGKNKYNFKASDFSDFKYLLSKLHTWLDKSSHSIL